MEESKKPVIARACYAAAAFTGLCSIASGIVVVLLQQHYQLSYALVGNLLAVLNLGNLVVGVASGLLTGRLGVRRLTLLFSGAAAIGYAMMPLSGAAPVLMLAFLLLGIAKGGTINNACTLLAEAVPDRTRSMNLLNAGFALGALACPFAVSALSGERWGWAMPFWVLAVLGAVNWLCFVLAPVSVRFGRTEPGSSGSWAFLRTGRFWLLTLLLFFQNASEVTVTSLVVAYFRDTGLLGGSASSYVLTLVWVCMLLSRLVVARWGGRVRNPFRLIALMCGGCVVTYLLMLAAKTPGLALLGLALYGVFAAGIYPTAIAAAGSQLSGQSLGVMLPGAGLGAVVMPYICGIAAEAVGIRAGMASIMAAMLGMFLMSLVCLRRIRPD